MKKLFPTKLYHFISPVNLVLFIILIISNNLETYSQVRVDFTPRTSEFTPSKTVYNVKGDFTMIGNTNLTLISYEDDKNNSNNVMVYVDNDNDNNTSNSSSATLTFSTENGAIPECSNIVYAGLYWTGRGSNLSNTRMRTVKFKTPNQSSYKTLVTNNNSIKFPGDNDMYAAYIEVTEEVKTGGIGEYWVADIALSQGNGASTGYYGGWGMVVIYENSKMKWRDITVFDGYAYVVGGTARHTIDVEGFKSVQNGDVNFKLGLMAGEGDVGISGDYFEILKQSDNSYLKLHHSGNTNNNFFNSSVETGGNPRNPMLVNNTGLDISMFDVPNINNEIITNNQTTTQFRYGSTQDTYIIFNVTFAVDAYVPETEGIVTTTAINGVINPTTETVLPGEIIDFKLEIKNKGTEATENTKIVIPIPYTSTYQDMSIVYNTYSPLVMNAAPYFDLNLGATGSIVWNIGTLPIPNNPDDLLAEISFKLKATTDCSLLVNEDCNPIVSLNGTTTGVGAISQTNFNQPLIKGYETSGVCEGEPIPTPLEIIIDYEDYVNNNCSNYTPVRDFYFCNVSGPIETSAVSAEFPSGSRFYNEYPVTDSSIEYNSSNPFPSTAGISTYYAVPPGTTNCYYQFTIEVSIVTSVPITENVEYCLNETASPLTATPSNFLTASTPYTLYYYVDDNPSTLPQTTIIPSTNNAGIITYYVAEGLSSTCISPNRVPISVLVYGLVVSAEVENVSCVGETSSSDGSIVLTVENSVGNLSYNWSTIDGSGLEAASKDQSGLGAGTYRVEITDSAGGCITVKEYTITAPAALTVSAEVENVSCVGDVSSSDGSIVLTVDNSVGNLSYNWSTIDGSGLEAASKDQSGLSAGTYRVEITDSAGGCTTVKEYTITAPATLTVSAEVENVSCVGETSSSDGSIVLTVENSVGNLSYNWSTIDGSGLEAASKDQSGLSAGTYRVEITDSAGGCTTVKEYTITAPAALTVSAEVENVSCVGDASSSDGSIVLMVENSVGNLSYNWSTIDGGGLEAASKDQSGLSAGTYRVEITDSAGGCTTIKEYTITAPDKITFTAVLTHNSCYGSAEGSIEVLVEGGSLNYQYAINNGEFNDSNIFNNLKADSYLISVIDTNGCEVTQEFEITEKPELIISCPELDNTIIDSCLPQNEVDVLFTNWLNQFSFQGGTNPVSNDFENISSPNNCGGSVEVEYIVKDDCNQVSCIKSFTVTAPEALIISGVEDKEVNACDYADQSALDTAFENWLSGFSVSGGCNPQATDLSNLTAPLLCEGGSVVVTYNVTDLYESGTDTATFTVTAPEALIISGVEDKEVNSCDYADQSALDTAFENWLSGFSVTGGCNPQATDLSNLTAPLLCEGGSVVVTYNVTDLCESGTDTATFTVTAPEALIISDVEDKEVNACDYADQSALDTAFENWLSGFSVTGGCNPQATDLSNLTAPLLCEGGSVVVTYNVTDLCESGTDTATFTVTAPEALTISDVEDKEVNSCDYADQSALDTAFKNWLSGFSVMGGCNPQATDLSNLTAPLLCEGGSVVVTYNVTDLCESGSDTAIFMVKTSELLSFEVQATSKTVECDGMGNGDELTAWLNNFGGAQAKDGCGNQLSLSYEIVTSTEECGATGVLVVDFIAEDICGNKATSRASFTIQDTAGPVLTNLPPTEIDVSCGEIPEVPVITVSDVCSGDGNVQEDYSETKIEELNSSSYTIERHWVFTDSCGNKTEYTQTVYVNQIDSVTEVVNICTDPRFADDFETISSIDLSELLSTASEYEGVWESADAESRLSDGIFDIVDLENGEYHFSFTTTGECSVTSYLTIIFDCKVLPCSTDDLAISKVVTPNDDGFNDAFEVKGLEGCGFTYDVKILNRWGKVVYQSDNYQNNWRGYNDSSGQTIGSNSKLPTGTYFYVLKIVDSGFKPITGYIYLGTH
ncbi:gliding motility-associated C-terminal domain-containing protein [Lutibacter sp. B1]|uniref:T9SS type B sorting domain-containing protein n=1 Tax=Lutibacter sp. B1 TaxID=2725996 RepID=UPI001456A43C|nr:gliding motility-associated C-terminal domain-containing protein [Lutibacter sp. B1]NLP57431.1 T9SS type B sorting domain-containing protein [Lutibacter sp. B1]